MNLRCAFGFHAWQYVGQTTVGGYSYQATPHVTVEVGRRTIYFRRCERCQRDGTYYPTGQHLADIIKLEQKI